MATTATERFEAAVNVIKDLPKDDGSYFRSPGSFQPSKEIMLQFYAYYKQATIGPCNVSRPRFYDVVGKLKWDAWDNLGQMDKETAMINYVDELKKIVEAMPQTEQVLSFVDKLGFFYEIVDENNQPIVTKGNASEPSKRSRSNTGSSNEPFMNGGDHHVHNGNGNGHLPNGNGMVNGNGYDDDHSDLEPELVDHSVLVHDVISSTETVSVQAMKKKAQGKHHLNGDLDNNNDHDGMNGGFNNHGDSMNNGHHNEPAANGRLNGPEPGSNMNGDIQSDDESEMEFCDTTDLYENSSFVSNSQSHVNNPALEPNAVPPSVVRSDTHTAHVRPHTAVRLQQAVHKEPLSVPDDMGMARGGGDFPESSQSGGAGPSRGVPASYQGQRQSNRTDSQSSYRQQFNRGTTGGGGGLMGAPPGGGDGPPMGGSSGYRSDVTDTQIALALVRLQQDMSSVLNRLNTLEALTLAQHNNGSQYGSAVYTRSRSRQDSEADKSTSGFSWLFNSLRPQTILFILAWPVALHFILKLVKRTRLRYIKKR